MKVALAQWSRAAGWSSPTAADLAFANLVLYFGDREELTRHPEAVAAIARVAPTAAVAGCSTAGEILGDTVRDGTIVAAFVGFDRTRVRTAWVDAGEAGQTMAAGARLAQSLLAPDLTHLLVLSDGLRVNGSALAAGLHARLPDNVNVTGGLAGDGALFRSTLTGIGDGFASGKIAGVGFYGDALRVRWGSAGGWEPFGPKRLVTRAEGNVLYTLDGQPALALYKRYLGERAAGLPATGLLFPLEILARRQDDASLVRTILGVNEEQQSLVFAGDVPAGHYARLMKASVDRLARGASAAALEAHGSAPPPAQFAVLVSCVGRRQVMGRRIEEEIEAVRQQLGPEVPFIGFYSYGELCPGGFLHSCELHNQTITLTVFAEEP